MPYLPFLVAAYGITLASLAAMLAWSLWRLRKVEKLLEEIR